VGHWRCCDLQIRRREDRDRRGKSTGVTWRTRGEGAGDMDLFFIVFTGPHQNCDGPVPGQMGREMG
jgi:hypothetical protein